MGIYVLQLLSELQPSLNGLHRLHALIGVELGKLLHQPSMREIWSAARLASVRDWRPATRCAAALNAPPFSRCIASAAGLKASPGRRRRSTNLSEIWNPTGGITASHDKQSETIRFASRIKLMFSRWFACSANAGRLHPTGRLCCITNVRCSLTVTVRFGNLPSASSRTAGSRKSRRAH